MSFALKTETFGQDNQSWLGSAHGTDAAESGTIDLTTLTAATHYPTGVLPSGTPLGKITASGKYGPYDAAASDGRSTLAGFTLTARKVDGTDPVVAVFEHGRVIEANLPFPVDAAGKTSAAGRLIFA